MGRVIQIFFSKCFLVFLSAFLFASCSEFNESLNTHYDVLIVGGAVYDGSNSSPKNINIGIIEDKIISMNASENSSANHILDATGYIVAPGFIDPHTHALGELISQNQNANINYLTQGVTTVFVGNDGGGIPNLEATIALITNQGIGTNMGFFVGHGDVRKIIMGLENRAPTEGELKEMLELTADQMRFGAIGLSTGLYYTPGSFAETDEVIALAKVTSQYGGVYDTHMRDESSYSIGLIGSIEEVIRIAKESDISVHISHLKALGHDVWGQSGAVIQLVDNANQRGLRITANQYPYLAGGTRFSSVLIPAWVRADSREAMFDRLKNRDLQDRIYEEMVRNLNRRGGPNTMLVTSNKSPWRGMFLNEIAEIMKLDVLDAAIEIIKEGDPSIASFMINENDLHVFATQNWTMTGSDGSEGHPRKYATYPKVFQDMVLKERLFSLEKFVYRSSGLVADTFNLCDRGYLEEGRKADIIVLDLERFTPLANFEDPTLLSTGVIHAMVNGKQVITHEQFTEELPGVVINRQKINCEDNEIQ